MGQMRKSISIAIAVVIAVLLARIFWPGGMTATGEEHTAGSGFAIQPVW
jgi:hypothetical protein